jgi:diguanylate cyclase (GGDEF)-like protein/PAS domain S-box-containing protein
MPISWNISLVLLSVLVAMIGSFAALTHAQRMRDSTGRMATLWMAAGGSTLGVAIWSMHFIGMLALHLPVPIAFDQSLTLFSVLPAIAAALLGFKVLRQPSVSFARIAVSGLLMGAGISLMHYTGMAALKMQPAITYNPLLFVLSVLIAVISSWGALLMMYQGERLKLRPFLRFVLGGIVMGLAISGMHYTAMLGAVIQPGSLCQAGEDRIDHGLLTLLVSMTAVLWFSGGIFASLFDRRLAQQCAQSLAALAQKHQTLQDEAEKQSNAITQALRALQDSEENLHRLLNSVAEGIYGVDTEGRCTFVNAAFLRILNFESASEVVGKYIHALIHHSHADGRHYPATECKMYRAFKSMEAIHVDDEVFWRRDGTAVAVEYWSHPVLKDGVVVGAVATFLDSTERKLAEQQVHQLAFYDALTGLPNRRLLHDRLNQAIAVSERNERYGALMFLDIDNFKTLNDTKGHDVGDFLLIEVARRLEGCVRDGDSVARLGGDEFVVVLEMLSSNVDEAVTQAELVGEKIREALNTPYHLSQHVHRSTSSIGIVLFKGYGESIDNLLKYADTAMYQAKSAGRNAIRFYDPKMQAALEARVQLEGELRSALEKQQFRLYYQIQMDSLRRAVGAEVLLRWEHPDRGLVSPLQFIPLAEETGLIIPVGLWVLQTACAQLKSWQNNALTRDLVLAVNVSAKQFRQSDFVLQVQRALLESGAKASHLKIELTESIVLDNVEDTINKMREIKMLGVSFSMDDFGTGYSSLQYLKRLPLDQIKIDQSFVRDITSDPNDAAIVQTIIAMTEAMGLNVIAEGVETEAQLEFLDLHGCHEFQGYLFSKPVPLPAFEALMVQLQS